MPPGDKGLIVNYREKLYFSDFLFLSLSIKACCLLLNLVEHSKSNRNLLMKSKAPEFLDDDDNDCFGGKSYCVVCFASFFMI